MQITNMNSTSRAGDRPVSWFSAAASCAWPSDGFSAGDAVSVDFRLGASRDPDSFSGIEAMVGCCK